MWIRRQNQVSQRVIYIIIKGENIEVFIDIIISHQGTELEEHTIVQIYLF
jgi:hypothetical protein